MLKLIVPLKVIFTFVLLGFLFSNIEIDQVIGRLSGANPGWLLLAVAILSLQVPVAAYRWCIVMENMEKPVSWLRASRIMYIGQFFSQAMPSFVAGDMARMWFARKEGLSVKTAITSVILDRMIGILGLAILVMLGLIFVVDAIPIPQARIALVFLVAFVIGGFLVFIALSNRKFNFLDRWKATREIRALSMNGRSLFAKKKSATYMICLALIMHILAIISITTMARSLGIQLDLIPAILLIPPALLLSMVPISFAGWGVREGAMITGLGMIGIAEHDALSLSVLFGLALIVVFLPGAFLWWGLRKQLQT